MKLNILTKKQFQHSVERMIENLGRIALIATVLAAFGTHAWWLDGLTHFRMQYVVVLILSLAWWLRRYKLLWIVLGMIGLVWNASYILSLYRGEVQKGTTQNYFTVMVFNIRSENTRYEKVLDYLKNSKADVFVIQEINERWMEKLEPWAKTMLGRIELPQDDNFGIAIYSRYPLEQTHVDPLTENTTPSLEGQFWFDGIQVHLLAVHPIPPGGHSNWKLRNRQLDAIAAWSVGQNNNAVVAGDLNVTPWSPFFDRLLRKGRLLHARKGFGLNPTWPALLPPLWVPLDTVLVQNNLEIVQVERGPALGSDHFPFLVTLQTRN